MKLTLFLSMLTIFQLFATETYSQLTKLTLKLEDVKISDALKEIENQSEFFFLYSPKLIDVERKVNIDAENETIKDILSNLFGENVKFAVYDRQVILTSIEQSGVLSVFQQQNRITGTVTDKNGPIPGVNVVVTGSTVGTITDVAGKYSIDVAQGSKSLRFSFIGMEDQEISIGTLTQINVTMTESSIGLEEVVVIGYGTQKKVNLTGAVSSIKYEEALSTRPTQNTGKALEGMITGLNVSSGTGGGQLDVAPVINIRGTGTIGQGSISAPLILINGIEGDLNAINPNDIDNISILKDAASAAIYGSRAAFGVILVTTKSGTMGSDVRTSVNYSGNIRFASPLFMAPYASAYEASKFYDEAFRNAGQTFAWLKQSIIQGQKAFEEGTGPEWGPIDPNNPNIRPDYYGTNDWNSTLYKEFVPSYENSLSITGGGNNYSFFISGSVLNQSGLLNAGTESWDRKNLNTNLSIKLSKKVKVDYIGSFSWINYDAPTYLTSNFYYMNSRRFAHQPWKYEDGNWGYDIWQRSVGVYLSEGGTRNQRQDNNRHKLTLTYEPLKDWYIHIDGGFDIGTDKRDINQLPVFITNNDGSKFAAAISNGVYGSGTGDDYVGKNSYENIRYISNIYTDYSKLTSNGHYFKVMLGFNAEQYHYEGWGLGKTGLITPDVIAFDAATSIAKNVSGNSKTWTTAGFFGRINYNYLERYLFEVNARYDGASRYIGDKRWGLFPSISAGWNIANEDFFEPFKSIVNLFKPRISYGSLGNMNTSSWYPFYPTMPINLASTYLINGNYSITSSLPSIVSSDLTWEKVQSWDFGLDIGVFNNRLTGVFDIFKRTTLGMVGPPTPIPNTLGTGAPNVNNADMYSSGFEITLTWRNNAFLMNSPFSYGLSVLLSDETQTVTSYNNANPTVYDWYKGKKMGDIWGYTTVGIARSKAEMDQHLASLPNGGQNLLGSMWRDGDIMYKDLDGDGKISTGSGTIASYGDLSVIGNNLPRYKFGINMNAAWKGFDVQVFFQGVAKRDLWPARETISTSYSSSDHVFWGVIGDNWTTQFLEPHMDYFRSEDSPYGANIDSYYPRPYVSGTKNNRTQTLYLQNAAYLRLKNLQIGYTIPTRLSKKVGIENFRVYFSGDNLMTLSKSVKLFDPEAFKTLGTDQPGSAYPNSRVISFGLNANF